MFLIFALYGYLWPLPALGSGHMTTVWIGLDGLMMLLSMAILVAMGIVKKHGLDNDIACKCNRSNSESWECALESVPSRKGTCIPPCLATTC